MAKNLRRKPGSRKPKDRVLILTEGEATEIEYFRGLCNWLGLSKELVIIEKSRFTQLKGMVDEAVELRKRNERETKRGRDVLIEQWWVVVDTEGVPGELSGAIQKARTHGIRIVISDPSIEFWLLLHFEYTTRQFTSAGEVIKQLKKRLPDYDEHHKHPNMETLIPHIGEAVRNARRLRANHTRSGFDQPRTDCDLLVDALAALSIRSVPFEKRPFDESDLSMNVCR